MFALSFDKEDDKDSEPPYPEIMSWVHRLKTFGNIRIWGDTLWQEPYVLYMEIETFHEAENIFANALLEETIDPDGDEDR